MSPYPICPNCGNEQREGMAACDSGFPDYDGGGVCNDCGMCIMDTDWEYEDDDDFDPEIDTLDGADYCHGCGNVLACCECD